MEKFRFCCPCQFGLESILKFEVGKLGGEEITVTDGKVYFSGDRSMIAKANLWLRTAERVLIVLNEFPAYSFEDLFQGTKKINLSDFVGEKDAFPVKGYSVNSKLHSIPDCQSIVKKALVESMKRGYHRDWFEESGAVHQIRFSIYKDQVAVCLDTTGTGLHKRGYRPSSGEAPLRETLACGIIDLARLRSNSFLMDPCCGSGTFLIEAAMRARNVAPGIGRNFAAEKWGFIPEDEWRNARKEALDSINLDATFTAVGSDIDERVLEIAKYNAKRARVGDCIRFIKGDLKDFSATEPCTIICNPPYGERLLSLQEAENIYQTMGKVFHPGANQTCHIISPHPNFEQLFGKKADKKRKLYNGMLQCNLFQYFK